MVLYIKKALYDRIREVMPIVDVEAAILGIGRKNFLLMKRRNSPGKGLWWFPGGRIQKGESFGQALKRKVKEETNLEVDEFQFVNVYSRVFPERHDVVIAFLCHCKPGKVRLNSEHSAYTLEDGVSIHPYVGEVIHDVAGLPLHINSHSEIT